MDDLTKHNLEEWHAEELADAEKYRKVAKDCPGYGGMLFDIAAEEESHARILKYILEKNK